MADKIKEKDEKLNIVSDVDIEAFNKTVKELNEVYKKLNEYEKKFDEMKEQQEKIKETKDNEFNEVIKITKEAHMGALPVERQPWEVLDNSDGDLVETEEYFVNK